MNIFSQKLKNKILFLAFIFSVFLVNIPIAKAITIEELQAQILKLQTQIAELQNN